MSESPRATEHTVDDVAAVTLVAGDYEATFLPGLGMVGSSLRWRGGEHVWFAGVDPYRSGTQTGLPLLHPWANRLSRFSYEVDGTWVDFDGTPPVLELDGLPIHGTMTATPGWRVEVVMADTVRALLQARYTFGEHPDHLRSFPFPHELVVFAELSDLGLRVTTSITNTGVRGVPVSFGWHPYFQLPGVPRSELELILPEREHLDLDLRMLPTGASTGQLPDVIGLGDGLGEVLFDDAYRLVDPGRAALVLQGPMDGGTRRLRVEPDDQYPYAQVYAPARVARVALEPMTALTNALVTGDHRTVAPGQTANATFAVRIEHDDPDEDVDEDEREAGT